MAISRFCASFERHEPPHVLFALLEGRRCGSPTAPARGVGHFDDGSPRLQLMAFVIPRPFAAALALALPLAGCATGGGEEAKLADTPPSTTATVATAPPMPETIRSYEPTGPPVKTTVRLFDANTPTLVHVFPVTMNGCANGLSTTRWRSLAGPITAGATSFADDPENVNRSDIRGTTTAEAGLVQTTNQCDQPVFISAASGISDVVVEYQEWAASP